MVGMYERKSRLTRSQQNRLLEYFVAGTIARAAGELVATSAPFFIALGFAAPKFPWWHRLFINSLFKFDPSCVI